MTLTIGFLVNPIAGMGGAVGLKGTDGLLEEAVRRGATPESGKRALAAVCGIRNSSLRFLTCKGPMGEETLRAAGIENFEIVYSAQSCTTSDDTRNACRAFEAIGVDLILFCGGDGTARDIYDVVLDRIPLLGIPAGVKMYSAVFAITPAATAEIIHHLANSPQHLRDAEVVDVNEEAYRTGDLRTQLHGYARSPFLPGLVQGTKHVLEDQDETKAKEGIGKFLAAVIRNTPEILYILGPGSTTGEIAQELGLEKTLLGFDVVKAAALVAQDMNESGLLRIISCAVKVRLVVSIIGVQGSVLGRGTQQISPKVLRKIGIENVIIVATPQKLADTSILFLDTGDPELDRSFGEYVSVISGYGIARRVHLGH